MEALQDREWAAVALPSVFENIQRGKRYKKQDHTQGVVPYVSSTECNNGVDSFIEDKQGTRCFKDCISLANSGSVGVAFYEPFKFVASDHVTSLKKIGATENEYLFLSTSVMKQKKNFDFNREINESRVKKMQIMLPVDDCGKPDYGFMESYVLSKRGGLIMRYKAFLEAQIEKLEHKDIPALSDVEWKPFKLSTVFENFHGKRLVKEHRIQGNVPLLTANSVNNGIAEFIGNEEMKTYSDFISVDMFCNTFVHPYTATGDDNIYFFKNDELSLYIKQFISTCIAKQQNKFSYGKQFRQQMQIIC